MCIMPILSQRFSAISFAFRPRSTRLCGRLNGRSVLFCKILHRDNRPLRRANEIWFSYRNLKSDRNGCFDPPRLRIGRWFTGRRRSFQRIRPRQLHQRQVPTTGEYSQSPHPQVLIAVTNLDFASGDNLPMYIISGDKITIDGLVRDRKIAVRTPSCVT